MTLTIRAGVLIAFKEEQNSGDPCPTIPDILLWVTLIGSTDIYEQNRGGEWNSREKQQHVQKVEIQKFVVYLGW